MKAGRTMKLKMRVPAMILKPRGGNSCRAALQNSKPSEKSWLPRTICRPFVR
jgi:hypothetical protein